MASTSEKKRRRERRMSGKKDVTYILDHFVMAVERVASLGVHWVGAIRERRHFVIEVSYFVQKPTASARFEESPIKNRIRKAVNDLYEDTATDVDMWDFRSDQCEDVAEKLYRELSKRGMVLFCVYVYEEGVEGHGAKVIHNGGSTDASKTK